MIDARPRVNNFTVTEGSRSPFEFKGESSMVPQLNTALRTFLTEESITISYDFYLPRVDSISLWKRWVSDCQIW